MLRSPCLRADQRSSVSAKRAVRRPAKAQGDGLPVIDISPLSGRGVRARRRVADALGDAAERAGFCYIEGHGIDQRTIRNVYDQARGWFGNSLEEKLELYIGRSSNHRGYVPCSEQGLYADEGARHYEAFDLALDLPVDDPDVSRGHHLLGPNVWPSQTGFRQTISGYYDRLAHLGRVMCGAFESYLQIRPGTLLDAMTKPTSQLRLLHYLGNGDRAQPQAMNMGAHTDYECFTILHQGAPGQQVLNASNQWIDAPPLDGTFVINIGDLLETWTNGQFRATLHRVVNTHTERLSLPFFVAANYDAVIRPLAGLAPREGVCAYKAIVAGHHLLGQLLRDFPYLRKRHQRGELRLPFAIPNDNPFELSRRAPAPQAI